MEFKTIKALTGADRTRKETNLSWFGSYHKQAQCVYKILIYLKQKKKDKYVKNIDSGKCDLIFSHLRNG